MIFLFILKWKEGKKTQLKTCSGSLLTSPGFACLTFSGLFLSIPASNTGSLKREKTQKEKNEETAGEERRLRAPSWGELCREAACWWTGRQRRTPQERRPGPPGPGRLPLSSARPAWGQFISLSLKFAPRPPQPNSKLGTIPRWGKKEEDGEKRRRMEILSRKLTRKTNQKSPQSTQNTLDNEGKKEKSICLNEVEGIPKTLYKILRI